jgi:ribonuclease HI
VKGDQITSFARFHSRVARVTKHRTARSIKHVDNVLRRIKKSPRHRSRSGPDITAKRQVEICVKDEFSQASNNEAEYEALLHRMKMAKACRATGLKIYRDSNLVVQQVMNKCDAISDNMTAYRNLYYYLDGTFDGCEVSHVSRASNEEADNLSNIGPQCLPIPPGVFWEEIIERSIKNNKTSTTEEQGQHQAIGSGAGKPGQVSTTEPEEVMMIEETWMQPYLAYMINKALPEDTVEAKRIIRRSKAFVVLQGKLYKKSITGILQ